jgi:hypothetical protein
MKRVIRNLLAVPVGCHFGFSIASICNSSQVWPFNRVQYKKSQPDENNTNQGPALQSKHSAFVVGVVLSAYGKCCVSERCFDKDVEFCDPVVCTSGFPELKETFRALGALKPKTLTWQLVSCEMDGPANSEVVTMDLWQMYHLGKWELPLYSRVVVEVKDRRAHGTSDIDTLRNDCSPCIVRISDCWNGVPLLSLPMLSWFTRTNGRLSYALTPWLLSDSTCDVEQQL